MEEQKLSRTEQLNQWKKIKDNSKDINKEVKVKSKPLLNIGNTINNINKLNNIAITTEKILGKRNNNKDVKDKDINEKKIKLNSNKNTITKIKDATSNTNIKNTEIKNKESSVSSHSSEGSDNINDMNLDIINDIKIDEKMDEPILTESFNSSETSTSPTTSPTTVEGHISNLDSNQTSLLLAQAVIKIQSIQHDYATLSDNSNKLVTAYNELFEAYEKEKESKALLSIFLKCAQAEAALAQQSTTSIPVKTVPKSIPKAVFQPFDDTLLKGLEDSSIIAGLETEVSHLNHNLAAVRFAYSINVQKLEEVQSLNRAETSELKEQINLKEEEIEELNKSVDTIQSQIAWAMDASFKKLSEKDEEIEELKKQILELKK